MKKANRKGHRLQKVGLFVGQLLREVVQAFGHHQEQRHREQRTAAKGDHWRLAQAV